MFVVRFAFVVGCLALIPTTTAVADSPVEAEARQLRLMIYKQYRTEREKFDAWQTAEQQIAKRWKAAGRPSAEEGKLRDWYHEAQAAIVENQSTPELPTFVAVAKPIAPPIASTPVVKPVPTTTPKPAPVVTTVSTPVAEPSPAPELPAEPVSPEHEFTGSKGIGSAVARALCRSVLP